MAVGVILAAALPAAADEAVSIWDNASFPLTNSPAFEAVNSYLHEKGFAGDYDVIQSMEYHYVFYFSFHSPDGDAGWIYAVGSSEPIKVLSASGYMGFDAQATTRYYSYTAIDKTTRYIVGNRTPYMSLTPYPDDPSLYVITSNLPAFGFAVNPYQQVANRNDIRSVPWFLVEDQSTDFRFYNSFTDNTPIGNNTTVSGGTGRNYEDFYSYDYDVDEEGNYVQGSGNINFDFGAGDKVKSFFNKGFFGEIRTWIQEGNDGGYIQPMTLFNFDVDYKNHHWHSDGFTLDFSDRNSFVSLLAFIVFPVYAFEILCNLWGLAFKILTGVPLWHISDSSVSVPLPDDDSAYLL